MKNLLNKVKSDWNKMDGMDKFGQIVSIPLATALTIVSLMTGFYGWAAIFVVVMYANWNLTNESFDFLMEVLPTGDRAKR